MIGREWLVEAYGCDAVRLRSIEALQDVLDTVVRAGALNPIGDAVWHRFPEPGGITGLLMLAESHLTVHTFPEFGSACFNLFCCRPTGAFDWEAALPHLLGASRVVVRSVERVYEAALETSAAAIDASSRAIAHAPVAQ